MVRFLITIALAYIFYRLFRNLFKPNIKVSRQQDPQAVISEMVQDPYCKTYIPRNEAYRAVLGGREVFFCSKECAEKFKQGEKEQKHRDK